MVHRNNATQSSNMYHVPCPRLQLDILPSIFQGGRFYFYEHIAEFDLDRHSTRRRMQEILTTLGIWPFIFDGCMLNRDMLADIQQAGFSKVQADRFYNGINHRVFQLVKPGLKGVAEKWEASTRWFLASNYEVILRRWMHLKHHSARGFLTKEASLPSEMIQHNCCSSVESKEQFHVIFMQTSIYLCSVILCHCT